MEIIARTLVYQGDKSGWLATRLAECIGSPCFALVATSSGISAYPVPTKHPPGSPAACIDVDTWLFLGVPS